MYVEGVIIASGIVQLSRVSFRILWGTTGLTGGGRDLGRAI